MCSILIWTKEARDRPRSRLQKPSQSPKDAEQESQKQFAKRPKIAKEKRNDKGSR